MIDLHYSIEDKIQVLLFSGYSIKKETVWWGYHNIDVENCLIVYKNTIKVFNDWAGGGNQSHEVDLVFNDILRKTILNLMIANENFQH